MLGVQRRKNNNEVDDAVWEEEKKWLRCSSSLRKANLSRFQIWELLRVKVEVKDIKLLSSSKWAPAAEFV